MEYRQELCGYIVSRFDVDASEAEDIVQSVFARFAEMESVQQVENSRAFLYKACINLAIDMRRRDKVRQGYVESMVGGEGMEEPTSIGPERQAESSQRLGILSRALWNMPGKRRKLLLMSRFDGLSFAEIARQVGLSEAAVRKHIAKALADCQRALQVQD